MNNEEFKNLKTTEETKKEKRSYDKQFWMDVAAWAIVIFGLVLVSVGIIYGIVQMAYEIISGEASLGLPTLELSLSLFIATLISFGLLFSLTYFLLWEKIKKGLEVRKTNIKANISIASYKSAQAEANLKASEEEIKLAKTQGKEIVDESKKEASNAKKEILAESKQQSEAMLGKTREQIAKEKKQMEDDIRKEILETSLLAAEKIIEKELDAEANKKMVEELLNQLK